MQASQDGAHGVRVVVHPDGRPVTPADVEPVHREDIGMASLPGSVRAARAVIRQALDAIDPERAERAVMCGTELVANAVRHGEPPIVLSVVRGPEDIVIAVADGSREPPRPRTAAHDDTTGRGTLIVDRLADRWGVDFLPGGKQVWCRITLGAGDRMVRA